jgi:hypothetical protein
VAALEKQTAPRRAALEARRADLLFDYPLPIPSDTVYRQLGVEPDATDDDIRFALAATRRRLEAEKRDADAELQVVFGQIPALQKAYQELDLAQCAEGQVEAAGLRHVQSTIAQLERKAISIRPRFKELRGRAASLGRQIEELNRLSLEKPEERQKYDSAHPPLGLLKLTGCTRDEPLLERRTTLVLLRTELSRFLEAQGEAVFHPSDLTRSDFSGDFTPIPFLDDESK